MPSGDADPVRALVGLVRHADGLRLDRRARNAARDAYKDAANLAEAMGALEVALALRKRADDVR